MSGNEPFDFSSFVSANKERTVSGFDYLHAIYKLQRLPPDFALWFAKLFWPEFKTVDDVIFISELFESKRYQGLLNDGYSAKEAQFWMNLLEITGLFDEMFTDQAMVIAELIASGWNAKLCKEFNFTCAPAKVICDGETGEVFITIGDSR